jgi:dihydroorotase-like cyclic amidohydrolase
MMIKLPGLVDPHTHVREPGATHKEDWESATKAALAGGFTTILAMPNTKPAITDEDTLKLAISTAKRKACVDYGQFLGADLSNAKAIAKLAPYAAGLKMYLDQTYGPLCLDDTTLWKTHFIHWPREYPLAVHAEGRTLAAAILMSAIYDRSIHICHVSRREEILLIREAKQKGIKVSCEVTPHHMFMTEADIPQDKLGMGEVRPRLVKTSDRDALWKNLDIIDCFAADHAPHTLAEKLGSEQPPGFPGLETALCLFMTAVSQGRLSMDDLVLRMYTNPIRIYNLPEQASTWIEVDPDPTWKVRAADMFSRCGWTPFEGWRVRGRLMRVIIRGQVVYEDGKVLAEPGSGKNVRMVNKLPK